MTGAELARWWKEHRRRSASRFPFTPFVLGVGCALLLAGWSSPFAFDVWVAASLGTALFSLFTAPSQLFWRNDTRFLATLPIAGSTWINAQMRFHLRHILNVSVVLLPSLVVLYPLPWEVATWLFVPVYATVFASIPIGYLGGYIAWKESSSNTLTNANIPPAPRAFLVGTPPAIMGAIVCATVILTYQEPINYLAYGLAFSGGTILLMVLAFWLQKNFHHVLTSVLQFDQEMLAHIDVMPPSFLERLSLRFSKSTFLLRHKDYRLLRRLAPVWYLAGAVGSVTTAIALTQHSFNWTLVGAVLIAFAVFRLFRLSHTRPTEQPILKTLPLSKTWAKRFETIYFGVLWTTAPVLAALWSL